MLHPSARDTIEGLAGRGLVLRPDVAAWRALRPKAAHGGRAGDRHEDIDQTLKLAGQVRRLATWMIFAIIGYARPNGVDNPQPAVSTPYRYTRLTIDEGEIVPVAGRTERQNRPDRRALSAVRPQLFN